MSDTRLPYAPLALLVTEHEWSARALESVLAPNGYSVLRAYSAPQALERARMALPDAIFVEETLQDTDGIELCRTLREQPSILASTPILLVASGTRSREQRLSAFRAGVWDVLRLPLDADEFLLQMASYLRAKYVADRAFEESLVDFATGHYSVEGVLRRAAELTSAARRYDRPLACIVIAPDAATAATDSEGTDPMGLLAEVLRHVSRSADAIGRLGHSEFVILAPDTDASGATKLAERIAAAAAQAALKLRAGLVGVPRMRNAEVDPSELLNLATTALRRAQSPQSRARIVAFPPEFPKSPN